MTNVVKFPRDHVRTLMRNARKQARHQGHELGRWLPISKGWPWIRYAYCLECGAFASVETKTIDDQKFSDHFDAKGLSVLLEPAQSLLTNEPNIKGNALLDQCPSPDPPHHPAHQGRLGAEKSVRRRDALKAAKANSGVSGK